MRMNWSSLPQGPSLNREEKGRFRRTSDRAFYPQRKGVWNPTGHRKEAPGKGYIPGQSQRKIGIGKY